MAFTLSKSFTFEAAHRLPNVPDGHKCARLHGHSFKVTVFVTGELAPEFDWVMDYGDISKVVKPIINQLDHYYLNEIEGLENPTSEVIARWIWAKLKPDLPELSAIEVAETCQSKCRYEP